MENQKHTELAIQDSVLKLLSDDEVSRVSTAEAGASLSVGEEYLDLETLDLGVQKTTEETTAMGRVLPKNAVHADTWKRILEHLAIPQDTGAPARS